MGHYTYIRGWLEIFWEDMVPQAQDIIQSFKDRASEYKLDPEAADLYLRGFVFREKTVNWSTYIFYGAGIRTYNVPFIEGLLREIAEKVSRTDGEFTDHVQGLFHVNDEDRGEMVVWLIDHGSFQKRTMDYPFTE